MSTKLKRLGYLMIDHRNSPGVSDELLAQCAKGGKPVMTAPKGQMLEADTCVCSHCNAVVVLNPDRKRPRNYCAKCNHYVCDNPGCALECNPFKKVLDELYDQVAR